MRRSWMDGFYSGGRGVFACSNCGRQTRTTKDTMGLELCPDCAWLCLWDNHFNDNGGRPSPKMLVEIQSRLRNIEAKGGNPDDARDGCPYLFATAEDAEARERAEKA